MDGESLDSEREPRRRVRGDQDPDILSELEQGGLRSKNLGGSHGNGSGFSMANAPPPKNVG